MQRLVGDNVRILHVFDHSIPLQSGYTFRSRSILLEQRQRGWETMHVTGGKQGPATVEIEEVDELSFYRTPPPPPAVMRIPVVNQFAISRGLERRILQIVERTKPDIIHAHSPALNGLAALRAGRRTGIPVVYEIRAFWEDAAVDHGTSTEGGPRYRATRLLESYVAGRVNGLTTICNGLRDDLVGRGIDPAKITVIPNAVDVQRFEFDKPRDPELESRFQLAGKPVIGFIGSFYAYEGIVDLMRALPEVVRSIPDLRVLLVGGGPCHDEVLQLRQQLKLDGQVICTGRIPHADVTNYYTLVDAFCYPRVSMRLTDLVTPLKPLEAMAQGKIVIASDVGGHRELIEHGSTGILYPASDNHALAQAIVQTMTDRSEWPRLKSAGRKFVESERSWARSVSYYDGVYEQARASVQEMSHA